MTSRHVDIAACGLIPDGQVLALEQDPVSRGPPHLVVGRGGHLAQLRAREGAACGHVQMRGQTLLGFDGGEVLHVEPGDPAQVLHEPVHELGKVQGVPRGPTVVIRREVGRSAVRAHPPVRIQGQGQEEGGPEHLARVRVSERPPDGLPGHGSLGQIRGVLTSFGGAHPTRTRVGGGGAGDRSPESGGGDFLVQVRDGSVQGGELCRSGGPGGGQAVEGVGVGAVEEEPHDVTGRPGGRVEENESLVDALRREVREETGLEVTHIEGLDTRLETGSTDTNVECFSPFAVYQTLQGPVDSMGVYFLCQAQGQLLSAGDETEEVQWMPVHQVAERMRTNPEKFDWVDRAGLLYYFRRKSLL